MKDLRKLYDALRAHERFQLAIKAMARGDEADAEALRRTSPKRTYEMPDTAITDRLDALMHLVGAHLMGMEQTNGKLTVHRATQDLLKHLMNRVEDALRVAYYRGFSDGGGTNKPLKAGTAMTDTQIQGLRELAVGMLNAIRHGIVSGARANSKAFAAACERRLGLDADTVLAGAGVAEILMHLNIEDLAVAQRLELPELEEAFISSWDRDVDDPKPG